MNINFCGQSNKNIHQKRGKHAVLVKGEKKQLNGCLKPFRREGPFIGGNFAQDNQLGGGPFRECQFWGNSSAANIRLLKVDGRKHSSASEFAYNSITQKLIYANFADMKCYKLFTSKRKKIWLISSMFPTE